MIEILLVSSIAVVGQIGGVSCEFFKSVEKSSYTVAGQQCDDWWQEYHERIKSRCHGAVCYSIYISTPTCVRETTPVWKREIGFCDDGTVRWRETAKPALSSREDARP